jgi:hypothetical protein
VNLKDASRREEILKRIAYTRDRAAHLATLRLSARAVAQVRLASRDVDEAVEWLLGVAGPVSVEHTIISLLLDTASLRLDMVTATANEIISGGRHP